MNKRSVLGLKRPDLAQRVGLSLWATACLAACAGALHQVRASDPHAVVELRFKQANRDFLYDNAVRIDGGEEQEVKSGEQVRLRPGTHRLELTSIAHIYGPGTVQVRKPGPCIDPSCTTLGSVTESQPGLVETGQTRCTEPLDIRVEANSAIVARLHVAADQTCTVYGDTWIRR